MRRITPLILGVALLGIASWAHAADEISGRVQSIDSTGRIITFTDGRTVVLDPGARALVNGREIAMQSIRPGTNVVVVEPPAAAASPATTSQPYAVTAPPPIEASGVVSQVDRQTGMITFQDGRQVQAQPGQTHVWQQGWQPSTIASVRPGDRILVQGAEPVGTSSGTTTWSSSAQHVTGNVARVDRATNTVVLDDGTIIHVTPSARFHGANGQDLSLSDLRPGSVVVMRVEPYNAVTQSGVTVQPGSDVSALPRQAFGQVAFSTDDVLIVRQPQAP